ncbi:MAG: hypothetical protein QOE36_468, partial [Gaiellaceae bacterium]|nr:hypothetical protein [Gaiellaceae bacterium]
MHEAQAHDTDASTSAGDPGVSLLGRFQQFARLDPARVAIVRGGRELSYGELDERSTRLAQRLRAQGVETESVVGICLPREPAFVVALLAVLKAGAAYLPLDPTYPHDRRHYMVTDAGAKVVIGAPQLAGELAETGIELVSADGAGDETSSWPEPQPHDLAYVMYTSGSTGRPKGVMIERRSMHAFVEWGLEA